MDLRRPVNWRQLVRNRHFHAAWIGACLVGVAIWMDAVPIALSVMFLIAALLMFGEWLIGLFKPESRRRRPFQD